MYSSGCLIPFLLANPANAKHARQKAWRAESQNNQGGENERKQLDQDSTQKLLFPDEFLPRYR